MSRRLVAVHKAKTILNIEGGLTMAAFALTICSEVYNLDIDYFTHSYLSYFHKNDGMFPDTIVDLNTVLVR